jgi:hypothetical protein
MIWGGSVSGAISLFSRQIISQRQPVFDRNAGPPPVQPMTEQRKPWLFRRCYSLFLSASDQLKMPLAPELRTARYLAQHASEKCQPAIILTEGSDHI